VNEFVDECRREWRRLGVPDPVANEMAADLTADLEEAAAEGGSPEDVLGNSAFDPRRFAAAWAVAQGVTGRPTPERPSLWRSTLALVLAAVLGALAVSLCVVLVAGVHGSSVAVVAQRIAAVPGPIRISPAGPGRFGPLGPFVVSHATMHGVQLLAALLFLGAIMGIGLLAAWCWTPWFGSSRLHRRGGGQPPSWH
jgi:hypothetical protein